MDITLQQINEMEESKYLYVDVRDEIAYKHGHIDEAVFWDGKEESADNLPKNKKLIVYCTYGENSIRYAKKLVNLGFDAYNLTGGYRQWLLNNFGELDKNEIRRYDRQIILPQMGSDGQKKLKHSKVLIVGAGGLGAPAALYLAGAGVGTIGIADADEVSISNLQRQIIHTEANEGLNKAKSAKMALNRLNSKVTVNVYPYFLTGDNIEQIIGEYDFIIDAVDNFETKFLINDACVLNGKPFCHAGILQFEGQVMTYVPGENPCYRCIFEEIPKPGSVPNCSQAGVIGAMAGVIGCVQALEAVKYIIGAGQLLVGKMFVMDGLTMNTRIAKFPKKNCNCRVCGDNPSIYSVKENIDEYITKECTF